MNTSVIQITCDNLEVVVVYNKKTEGLFPCHELEKNSENRPMPLRVQISLAKSNIKDLCVDCYVQ